MSRLETRVEQRDQTELATVIQNGQEFTQLGASVNGTDVTGYVGKIAPDSLSSGRVLTNWQGRILCGNPYRYRVFRTYRDHNYETVLACGWALTRSRWIVGYSLGDGMLFRGELLRCSDEDEASIEARALADRFMKLDAEDDERHSAEHEQELHNWDD